jgi:hypothetical protein
LSMNGDAVLYYLNKCYLMMVIMEHFSVFVNTLYYVPFCCLCAV